MMGLQQWSCRLTFCSTFDLEHVACLIEQEEPGASLKTARDDIRKKSLICKMGMVCCSVRVLFQQDDDKACVLLPAAPLCSWCIKLRIFRLWLAEWAGTRAACSSLSTWAPSGLFCLRAQFQYIHTKEVSQDSLLTNLRTECNEPGKGSPPFHVTREQETESKVVNTYYYS